jgi:hypothetical protein
MLSNIIKLLGGISVAFIIGYIVGVRSVSNHNNQTPAEIVSTDNQVERTVTTTTEQVKPDGSRTTKTVTDTTRVTDRKEDRIIPVAQKEPKKKARFGIQARPEWVSEKEQLKFHPAVTLGYRIYETPLWADLHLDIDRKEVAIGISVEW